MWLTVTVGKRGFSCSPFTAVVLGPVLEGPTEGCDAAATEGLANSYNKTQIRQRLHKKN